MNQIGRSEELLNCFIDFSMKHSKLFIQDVGTQGPVLDSLAKHFVWEELVDAVDYYIRECDGVVTVMNFALQSRAIVSKAQYERDSKARFQEIVEQTRKRMEDLS